MTTGSSVFIRFLLPVVALLALPTLAQAGAVDSMWVSQYFVLENAGKYNQATDIGIDENGGVYVCGKGQYDPSNGWANGMLFVRYDEWGDTVWVRGCEGDVWTQQHIAHALALEGGSIYSVGGLDNQATFVDATWVKYDTLGNQLWLGSTGWPAEDILFDLAVSQSRVVYACGARIDTVYGLSAFLLMSIDALTGDTVWTRSYILDTLAGAKTDRMRVQGRKAKPSSKWGGGRDRHPEFFEDYDSWENCATALALSPDGGIVVTGFGLDVNFEREWWTMKFDSLGNRLWQRTYHNPTTIYHDDDVAFDVAVANDGQVYAVGFDYIETEILDQGYNYAIARYNSVGVYQNNRSINIGGTDGDDYAAVVVLDENTPQSVYVTGSLEYDVTGSDLVTHKLTQSLGFRWGASGAVFATLEDDLGYDLFHGDSMVYVTGSNGDNLVVLAYTDADGMLKDTLWSFTYNQPDPRWDYGTAICALDSNRVYVAGESNRSPSPFDWSSMAVGRFFYSDRDMRVDSILAPSGVLNGGEVVIPEVRVTNEGNTRAKFTTHLEIQGGYRDSVVWNEWLMPGESAQPQFPQWTAHPGGVLAVRCSVALAGDVDGSNDTLTGQVTVLSHDVGATRITAPTGQIDSNAVVTPACSVYNYGSEPETYQVRMKIGGFYEDTTEVRTHQPGTRVLVQFATQSSWPRGQYAVSCSTELVMDDDPGNDKATNSVSVGVRDAGCTVLIAPQGELDSGVTVVPACTVYNFGTGTLDYLVRMKVGDFYDSTALVAAHLPQTSRYVAFPAWVVRQVGNHVVSCSTELDQDMVASNDEVAGQVSVVTRDVGVVEITAPSGQIDSGVYVVPEAKVLNYGSARATFPVWFRIHTGADAATPHASRSTLDASNIQRNAYGAGRCVSFQVYEDSVWIALPPGESVRVAFEPWLPEELGTYELECFTELTGDLRPENDTAFGQVIVRRPLHDVGAVQVIAPVGRIDSGTVVIPKALVENFGTATESFRTYFAIAGFYSDTQAVNLDPGQRDTVSFMLWMASPVGIHPTLCVTLLGGDANPANDSARDSVSVIPPQGLTEEAGLPTTFGFERARPNPFGSGTVIRCLLPSETRLELAVYSVTGTLVRTLRAGVMPAGRHSFLWDGCDARGGVMSGGIYLAKLTAEAGTEVQKLVLTR